MELVKEQTESTNGTTTEKELAVAVKNTPEEIITEQDLTNLKMIFDWAIQVVAKDRNVLDQVRVFEEIITKKLKNLIKK